LMAMPDAIDALIQLAVAPRDRLTRAAYNTTAFNPTAAEIHAFVQRAFPDATMTWAIDEKRQRIVDSWPAGVDDRAARRDWSFSSMFDSWGRAFDEYLVPRIRERYRTPHRP